MRDPVDVTLLLSNAPKKPRVSRAFLLGAKNAVLGERYELSLAFITSAEMKRYNNTFRGKNTPTDILSFPLSKLSGEILFSMTEVKQQAVRFGRTPENFLKFLFIHGLLHLKGYAHGSTMEKQEIKFRKKFGI